MTKTIALLVGTGFVVVVIVIALLITIKIKGCPPPPENVEIIAPEGTQVFTRLLDEPDRYQGQLDDTSLTLSVRVDATVVLRYQNTEKSFRPEARKDGKIVWRLPKPPKPPPLPKRDVIVSINAVPWAEVYIKLPGTDRFIKPPEKKSNVTPIRGGLRVPIGTAIKLVYENEAKIFSYEAWKTSKSISHDFHGP
jgi:hypothetical protein